MVQFKLKMGQFRTLTRTLIKKKNEMKTKLIEFFYPVDKQLRVFRKMVEAKRFPLSKEAALQLFKPKPAASTPINFTFLSLKKAWKSPKELLPPPTQATK